MKVFQITQKNFASTGIGPKLINQSYPFNARILIGLFILSLGMTFSFVYTVYEAKSFAEYTQTIYICSATVIIFLALLILISKVKSLFRLTNGCDKLVNTSE